MTDTTPILGYPFPEPADARGAGADAIRDLALSVETSVKHAATILTIPAAESASAAATTGTVVDYAGAPALAGFTYSAGTITYTGPAVRMFLLATDVEVEASGSNLTLVTSTLEVRHGATVVSSSHDRVSCIDEVGGTIQSRRVVHHCAVPMILTPGDTITVTAYSTPAGTVGLAGIRVYPIGPLPQ